MRRRRRATHIASPAAGRQGGVLMLNTASPPTRANGRPAARAGRSPATPLGVTHVVLSMDVGGSERNVINQVREGRRLGQDVSIVCIERRGTLASAAESLGARVVCLNKPPGVR